jgi:hypothetical protein
MNTHPYEYTYVHHIFMSTSKRLSRLDLEIYEVGHQERLISLALQIKVTLPVMKLQWTSLSLTTNL